MKFIKKEIQQLNPEYWRVGEAINYNGKRYTISHITHEQIFVKSDDSSQFSIHIDHIKGCNIDICKKIDYKTAFEELSKEYKNICRLSQLVSVYLRYTLPDDILNKYTQK